MSVEGTYRISADTPMGVMDSTLTLKTRGEELTGTMSAGMIGTIDFDGGKVDGSNFSFAVTVKKFFKKIDISGKGMVEGDRISGRIITSYGESCFEGVRV
jgi:hypothetical protein